MMRILTEKRENDGNWNGKSRLVIDRELYKEQCNTVNCLIKSTKTGYYSHIINENKDNQKVLFNTVDKLLHRKVEKRYPTAASAEELANTFVDFFYNKIDMIRNELSDKCKMVVNRFPDNQVCSTEFVEFQSVSENQVSHVL